MLGRRRPPRRRRRRRPPRRPGLRARAHRRDVTRDQAEAAQPKPTHVADSLGRRSVLRLARLASRPHGRPGLPDRQPARRRRPRAAAAARRRGGAARAGTAVPGRAHDLDGARARAGAGGVRRRRDRGGDGRRRDHRRGGGRVARRQGAAGRAAGRARQRLRAQARDPVRPGRGREAAADRARDGGSTSPRPAATTYLGILVARDRLRRQPDRARDAAEARHASSTPTACCARSSRWREAAWERDDRRRDRAPSPATPSRSATPACSAAGCTSRPTRRSTTACWTSC